MTTSMMPAITVTSASPDTPKLSDDAPDITTKAPVGPPIATKARDKLRKPLFR
jgi:hypothetical protein